MTNDGIFTQVVDYGVDYPKATGKSLGQVSYGELMAGSLELNGQEIPAIPLSSVKMAREISDMLKGWIEKGEFLLGEPQMLLPANRP